MRSASAGGYIGSHDTLHASHCGHNSLVFDGYTFWWTRGTRGVHDTGEVLGIGWDRVDGVLRPGLSQLVHAKDFELRMGRLQLLKIGLLDFGFVIVDDGLQCLGVLENVEEGRNQIGVKEDGLGAGLDKRVSESLFTKGVIGGNNWDRLRSRRMRHTKPMRTGCVRRLQ